MGEEMTPLGKFIMTLATDPKALQSYRLNPDAAMKAAGLSPEEDDAMKSKDPGRIRAALGGPIPAEQLGMIISKASNVIVLVL